MGLCSNWITRLKNNERVALWIKKGTLTFPTHTETPVIMVGPGTGIAPFRAYSSQQMLHAINVQRKIVVFFGQIIIF